ncbi:MAG: DUF3035 domain-containing protein [Sphingorhabdus sp.]
MKNKLVLFGSAASVMLGLSGCASAGNAAEDLWNWDITKKQAASQPASSRAAPLVIPPDFALTPSQTGAPRPQETGQEQVLEALLGGPAPRSVTERAITTSAGTADAGIRSSVGDPNTVTVNKGSVTRDIIAAPEGDGQTAQAVIPG